MSYLIHNFNVSFTQQVFNPRVLLQLIFTFLHKILFFNNLNSFFAWTKKRFIFDLMTYSSYWRSFDSFFKNFNQLLYKTTTKSIDLNYNSNLKKSLIYWFCNIYLKKYSINDLPLQEVHDCLFYNKNWFTIKLLNYNGISNAFTHVFFFYLQYTNHVWLNWNTNFKYHQNFFLLNSDWYVFIFYNGPFFKIYNF